LPHLFQNKCRTSKNVTANTADLPRRSYSMKYGPFYVSGSFTVNILKKIAYYIG